jgi:3-oxoacyl-[acyl-carrier-protein] synthase III
LSPTQRLAKVGRFETGSKVLEIDAYGAWNGGTAVDNSAYAEKGLTFKGGVPVNNETIEERIGVRSRIAAPADARIGVLALQNLIDTSDIDLSQVKVVIGATNVGEDLSDPGPLVRFPYELLKAHCPNALVLDLYAGCPGFNVSVELVFMLALTGQLKKDDLAIIIGAENIHRAKAFPPDDTANIIFGDDAMATSLKVGATISPEGKHWIEAETHFKAGKNYARGIGQKLHQLIGDTHLNGIILDNQLGNTLHRIPALAARVQHELAQLQFPHEKTKKVFRRFKEALEFYDGQVQSFAFDIITLSQNPQHVDDIARAYVASGRHKTVAAIYVDCDGQVAIKIHCGRDFKRIVPQKGIVDAHTRTHGCFGDYIKAIADGDKIWGEMDGKGVFLYATRGACAHLSAMLARNNLTLDDIELVIEHQANFALIPLTLGQLLADSGNDIKKAVADFVENKMIMNIHNRGNCSVVCMPRLPYDLKRGALRPDTIQGFRVNGNLEELQKAKIILNDSVGAGMLRSSFLQRL